MSVYKLYCKDPTITDFYIGSCKDMEKRKKGHKYNCHNINQKKYNIKLYKKIRETGFDNWDFEILEKVEYENDKQLRILERKWYDELKPTLNTDIPLRTGDIVLYLKNQGKEYYIKNKEIINKKHKENYEKNKESITKRHKEYRDNNKEKQNKKAKEKITCELCNCEFRRGGISSHNKSQKHIKRCRELSG